MKGCVHQQRPIRCCVLGEDSAASARVVANSHAARSRRRGLSGTANAASGTGPVAPQRPQHCRYMKCTAAPIGGMHAGFLGCVIAAMSPTEKLNLDCLPGRPAATASTWPRSRRYSSSDEIAWRPVKLWSFRCHGRSDAAGALRASSGTPPTSGSHTARCCVRPGQTGRVAGSPTRPRTSQGASETAP